jgi:hypothetical protein
LRREEVLVHVFTRALVSTAVLAASGTAAALSIHPWRDHAPPFDFLFGNEFDSHQETRESRGGGLSGFFYVSFTGVTTTDGYRVATHVDCDAGAHCTVGWLLKGRPTEATLVSHDQGSHPLFSLPRADIPQPGAYSHFHWLGDMPMVDQRVEGYLLELISVDRFCFMHHGAAAAQSTQTCRDNGGIPVTPGLDVATHLNIVGE